MNNFHIYEEVGRGKYSVVYKVIILMIIYVIKNFIYKFMIFVYNHIL